MEIPRTILPEENDSEQFDFVLPGESHRKIKPTVRKSRPVLRELALAEVIMGFVSILFGSLVIGIVKNARESPQSRVYPGQHNQILYDNIIATGEGIWCGFLVIIAGTAGKYATGKHASRCACVSHLVLSIIALVFSGLMIILASAGAVTSYKFNNIMTVYICVCGCGLLCMIFLSVSIYYVSISLGYCCSASSYGDLPNENDEHENKTPVTKTQPNVESNGKENIQKSSNRLQDDSRLQSNAESIAQKTISGSICASSPSKPTEQVKITRPGSNDCKEHKT